MTPTPDQVKALYLVFASECAGIRVVESLTCARMYPLGLFLTRWTCEDLRLTMRYLKKKFHRKNEPEYIRAMLHFQKLFGDPEFQYFEQWYGDALDDKRNSRPPRTERQSVLAATHRHEPTRAEQDCARPVGDVAADMLKNRKGWEQLNRELREQGL